MNNFKSIGSLWLKKHFELKAYTLTHRSYIGPKDKIEVNAAGEIDQVYGPKYAPGSDRPVDHLEFLLKYDDISLEFLQAVFDKLEAADLIEYIKAIPSGKYARKLGFLYEFLTHQFLEIPIDVSGNYIDLLDEEKYITGSSIKDIRWRINNNLLGNQNFCPVIRKTNALRALLQKDLGLQLKELKQRYSPDIIRRATNYLYTKETRSSYEIEKEKPSPLRMQRFIALLTQAGKQTQEETLSEKKLTQLQNAIVDDRFKANGFRNFQNYIGQTIPRYEEIIHYICPPPEQLNSLTKGLKDAALKTDGVHSIVRASIIAFGFVFIHPFEDGNGRIHRFLIHDTLTREGVVPEGFIIPVSAHMLNNMQDYDQALEKYSQPLMLRIQYKKNDNSEIEITNKKEVEGYYRYPDLTAQAIYLAQTIYETINEDMSEELEFIQHYDEVKKELQNIVDMPDKQLNLMILFLHQNHGIFPKRRRKDFEKLTEDEINQMEKVYKEIFNIAPADN
jgi:Fic family protein